MKILPLIVGACLAVACGDSESAPVVPEKAPVVWSIDPFAESESGRDPMLLARALVSHLEQGTRAVPRDSVPIRDRVRQAIAASIAMSAFSAWIELSQSEGYSTIPVGPSLYEKAGARISEADDVLGAWLRTKAEIRAAVESSGADADHINFAMLQWEGVCKQRLASDIESMFAWDRLWMYDDDPDRWSRP